MIVLIIIIRTLIIYIVVIFSLRFAGKKQIGQLEPSELTVAIMISELATVPLSSPEIPLLDGIVPVLVLASIEIIVSIIILKTIRIRRFITGTPCIVVEKGSLKEENLRDTRFTTDDLLEEMRLNGISDIAEIQYAILETSGKVSFILNKKDSPITYNSIESNFCEEELSFPIINKGIVLKGNLKLIGRDEKWLKKEIKKKHITSINDILLMTANSKKIVFLQKRSC